MMQYQCLVPGCQWHTSANSEAEVTRRAADHLREVHGETVVRPEMIDRIKARIQTAQPAH